MSREVYTAEVGWLSWMQVPVWPSRLIACISHNHQINCMHHDASCSGLLTLSDDNKVYVMTRCL